jgi:NAD(P)-dependent dehydrogenase (short-subunit alcohol dehydrogenase family)
MTPRAVSNSAAPRALGRDKHRAAQAAAAARQKAGQNADIRPVACDLSSLVALRVFVAEFSRQEQRLDVLVNNAGVMPDGRTHTVDGLESMFATRVLAPWALIDGLLRC